MHIHPFFYLPAICTLFAFSSSCGTSNKTLLNEQAATANAGLAKTMLTKAKSYQKAGKNRKAISSYKKIYKKYPYSPAAPEALYAQAYLQDKQGDLIKSFDTYQELITNYQNSNRYATTIKRQETLAHAAANGIIKNNFLGMKSRIAASKVETMLGKVRDNAPRATSAPRAQFAIAQVWQRSNNSKKAVAAFHRVSANYPESLQAPEALFQIGEALIQRTNKGNKNKANYDNATSIYSDLIHRYPRHKRAKDAKKRIVVLKTQGIQRSFNIAEFYRKKGNIKSALFYYNDVLKLSKRGPLYNQAKQRIAELKK